jgi:myosin-5
MLLVENDVVLKPLNREQVADSRDALMRTIYCALFDWIVSAINVCMQAGANAVAAEIGILDIFGFETFKNNYFEQLCINYANETLQQHFNKYVFEFEQLEYREEGIEWNFIDYPGTCLSVCLLVYRVCMPLIHHMYCA